MTNEDLLELIKHPEEKPVFEFQWEKKLQTFVEFQHNGLSMTLECVYYGETERKTNYYSDPDCEENFVTLTGLEVMIHTCSIYVKDEFTDDKLTLEQETIIEKEIKSWYI